MNAPVHAAGPWRIDGQFDDEVGVTIVSAAGFDLCEVYPLTGAWSPEDRANAHALKAAPQLLKCLKEAIESLGGGTLDGDQEEGDGDPLREWREAVAYAEDVDDAGTCKCGAALVYVVAPGLKGGGLSGM